MLTHCKQPFLGNRINPMRAPYPQSIMYHIKLKLKGQRVSFTAPYQNSSEAIARLMEWVQNHYGDEALPLSVSVIRARAH